MPPIPRLVADALALMDRWSERIEGHHPQRREFPRTPLRLPAMVTFPDRTPGAAPGAVIGGMEQQVYLRNISRNGLEFLSERPLFVDQVVLELPGPVQRGRLLVQLIRSRVVHQCLWNYGAELLERLPASL